MKKIAVLIIALLITLSLFICNRCSSPKPSSGNNDENPPQGDQSNDKENDDDASDDETEKTEEEKDEPVYSEGLEYSLSKDRTYFIVDGKGTCKDYIIKIPPTYNGLPVKEIGFGAFGGGWFVKPDIPYIIEVEIPDTVEIIQAQAFANNSYIKKITLGNSVKSIADNAFANCDSIVEVHIKSISSWCSIAFETSSSTPFTSSVSAKLYLNKKEVVNLVIPEDVTEIKDNAFYKCGSIKSVLIGDSVTKIGSSAFKGCLALLDVTIGRSVSYIGSSAFSKTPLLRATFNDKDGWSTIVYRLGSTEPETSYISYDDLSSVTVAATYLADTYNCHEWKK